MGLLGNIIGKFINVEVEKLVDMKVEAKLAENVNFNTDNRQQTVIHKGLNYFEAKDLFTCLLHKNFPKLIDEAANKATERVKKFEKTFFLEAESKLTSEEQQRFSDPDIQYTCNEAIKTIARQGNEDKNNILTELIIERVKSDDNEIKKLVTNEAVSTVGKLSSKQLSLISFSFLIKDTRQLTIENLNQLEEYLKSIVIPFFVKAPTMSDFEHIAYAGCGQYVRGISSGGWDAILKSHYQNLNTNELFAENTIFSEIKEVWQKSLYSSLNLTTVGKLLAIKLIKIKTPMNLNEDIWIN